MLSLAPVISQTLKLNSRPLIYLTVFVEVYGLVLKHCIFLCLRIALDSSDSIDYNSVVIDLPNLIEVPQVVKADFAIEWNKKAVDLSRDTHIDITETSIHMYKNNVVIEDK